MTALDFRKQQGGGGGGGGGGTLEKRILSH
jgi:hypothetical protein